MKLSAILARKAKIRFRSLRDDLAEYYEEMSLMSCTIQAQKVRKVRIFIHLLQGAWDVFREGLGKIVGQLFLGQ